MAYLLRRIVSKQKRRYQEDGYDLDLAYITPRIIAMALPGTGKEALYRNRLPDVARFLAQYHGEHARVYNLCAEYSYECDALCGDVVTLPLHDHQAAPLHMMQAFCESAAAHLDADERNVVAVHCKAGKGRTGQLICGLLLYQGICSTPEEALSLYGERRTHNHKGVTIPSQRRYVEYFGRSLPGRGLPPPPCRVRLATLTLSGLPEALLHECIVALHTRPPGGPIDPAPLAVLVAKGSTRKAWGRKWRRVEHAPLLAVDGQFATVDFSPMYGAGGDAACVEGDVKVQVFHGAPRRANSLFYCWLNTAFLEAAEGGAGGGGAFSAVRWQLDRVKPKVPPNVLLELHFDDVPPPAPTTPEGDAAAAAAAGAAGEGTDAVRGEAVSGAGGTTTPCSSDDGAGCVPRSAHGGAAAAPESTLQPFDVEAPAACDTHGGVRRRRVAAPDPFLQASSGIEPALDRERWHAHEQRHGRPSRSGGGSGGERSRSGRGGGGAGRGEVSTHGSDVGGDGGGGSDAAHAPDGDGDAVEAAGADAGSGGGRPGQHGGGGGRGGRGTAPAAVLQQELVWVGASS